MAGQRLYRVAFFNHGRVYEVYARSVTQGNLLGFVEIESLVFGDSKRVVVDPGEEKLADEFADVVRSYIPMHAVIRIDEVKKPGTPKISDAKGGSDKVMPFPVYTQRSRD